MKARVAGYDIGIGYVYKCPICGTLLSCKSAICPNCQAEIDSYEANALSAEYPKVCVDLHGVSLDMMYALKTYLKQTYDVNLNPKKVTDYDFQCDLGFDSQLVFEAFNDPELQLLVKPYDGVESAIQLLNMHCFPYAYTGVIQNPTIIARTNVQIHQLGLMGEALQYDKPVIYDANVLFDDSPDVHRKWWMAGFPGLQYIIDRPYNQPTYRDEDFWNSLIRVKSLHDGVVDMYKRYGWELLEV